MIVTLSWPRISQLIRELENLPTATDDEIEVRLATYARKAFDECASQFGIRVGGLSQPATKTVAYFFADISGCRDHGAAFGVDWAKLIGGLNWLRVVAVTVTEDDWATFCDKFIGSGMAAAHDSISENLTNIGVDELPAHIEQWVTHVCWKTPTDGNGTIEIIPEPIKELLVQSALGNAGLRDPLEKVREIDEYNRQEIETYEAGQRAANEARWKDR